MEKYYYKIDFSNVRDYISVYETIITSLEFPEYCGRNYDAIYDFLTDMITRKSVIEIRGFEIIEKKYGDTWNKLLECFVDAKHYANGKFSDCFDITLIHEDGRREKVK